MKRARQRLLIDERKQWSGNISFGPWAENCAVLSAHAVVYNLSLGLPQRFYRTRSLCRRTHWSTHPGTHNMFRYVTLCVWCEVFPACLSAQQTVIYCWPVLYFSLTHTHTRTHTLSLPKTYADTMSFTQMRFFTHTFSLTHSYQIQWILVCDFKKMNKVGLL